MSGVSILLKEVIKVRKISIISLIFIFCLSFLTSPALASNEAWKTPPIPQGWSHLEGTWDTGYVIKDSHGNEFVWVPVGAVNNVAGIATLKEYDWGKGLSAPSQVTYEPMPNQITNAIANTGGFYIARYEMSNNGGKAQSKKGISPWNNINWANSKARSESMSSDYGWTGVYSHLLYDKEWDVTVKWLQNSGINVTDSSSYGNYNSSLKGTGSSESYKTKNIYDLAGNLWEWTMDAYSTYRLYRGGSFNSNGADNPVSSRYYYNPDNTNIFIGFRSAFVVLNSAPHVALESPAGGANMIKGTLVPLTWSASDPDGDAIAGYELRIGTSIGNGSLGTYSGTNTSYNLNTNSIAGPYPKTIYWAVRAKDSKNLWSGWKEGTFKITASDVATLSNLTISEGDLDFNSNTLNYTVNLPFTTTNVNIAPTVTEANASIKVNGDSKNSGQAVPINLSVGNNEVEIEVTAQDGATSKTYIINIKRAANVVPIITLDNLKDKYSEIEGHNAIGVTGIVTDADNDEVTVYIQIKKAGELLGNDSQVLTQCQEGKEFSFELIVDNTIAEGEYTITLWADDGK